MTGPEAPDLTAIAERARQAISAREVQVLAELLAPDCEIVPLRAAVDHTIFRGPDAVARWFAAQDDAWEGMTAEVESWREGLDWALSFGRLRARGRRSGAPLDVQAAAIYRFREGRITSIRIYTNRAEALADVGLAPDAAAEQP